MSSNLNLLDWFVTEGFEVEKSGTTFHKCTDCNRLKLNIISFNYKIKPDTNKLVSKLPFFLNEIFTIYRLPLDLFSLNKMHPLEYLKLHTNSATFRLNYLKQYFNKYKFEESLIHSNKRKDIIYKENLLTAIQDIGQNLIKLKHLEDFITFLDLNQRNQFDYDDFKCLIQFSELYFRRLLYGDYSFKRKTVEFLDFRYLFTRLDTNQVNKKLYLVLKFINEQNF